MRLDPLGSGAVAALARLAVDDAASFRAAYVRAGGQLEPDPDAACFWVVADILGFLPDPAHILAAVGPATPRSHPDHVRHGLEELLAATIAN